MLIDTESKSFKKHEQHSSLPQGPSPIATKQDYISNKKNIKDAEAALKKCRELAQKENLKMKILDFQIRNGMIIILI